MATELDNVLAPPIYVSSLCGMRPVGPEGHREKLWLGTMKGQERHRELGNLQPISGKTPAYLRCQDHGTTTKDSGRYRTIRLESMRETIYSCREQSQKRGAFKSIWRQENHESQALDTEQLKLLELVLFDHDFALIFFLK